ncbi:MAG TPA: ArgE/DapE family deacylase [Anaerolineae bacterium]|nr:ArgE/DapE family deacylase [Anaerolineae bacterium]
MDVERAVVDWLANHQAQMVVLLRKLIRQPSIPGQESSAQQIVLDHLLDLGLGARAEEINVAGLTALSGYSETGCSYAGRPNVVARQLGEGGGRSLILSSHIDVVPVEAGSGWTHEPWAAEIDGNRLYGRGAWDDKPGIALILIVLRALRELDVRLCGDLEVQSVPDEEGGGNATLALCAAGHRADTALFVDGVRCAAVTGFMGQTWFRVCVPGLSSGGVSPDRGVNPVPLASKLIEALYDLEDEMNDALKAGYGGQQRPVRFNVGRIQAGAWSNSVPSCCVFDGQINFPPSKTLDWAQRRVREAIADAAVRDRWLRSHPPTIHFVGVQTSGCHDTSSPELLHLLGTAHRDVWHQEMEVRQILGFIDTRHYLAYGIPSVCYGPMGANAHGVDEYLDLETLLPTAQAIALFVLRWCGTDS